MMNIQFLDIVNVLITATAGAVGWIVGHRKQKNDFLSELQASIDLLAEKNKKLMEEVIKLREENAALREELTILRKQLEKEVRKLKEYNKQ